MAQEGTGPADPRERREAVEARNPRNAADHRPSGRVPDATLIVILTVLLVIVAGVFVFRMSTRPPEPDAAGDRSSVDRAGERLPGGFDPQPTFDSTREELEHRGAGEPPQGPMPGLGSGEAVTQLSDLARDGQSRSGQPVQLEGVEVESSSGSSLWIREDGERVAVLAPAGTPALQRGQRVDVTGRVETNGDEVRINATRVELTQ